MNAPKITPLHLLTRERLEAGADMEALCVEIALLRKAVEAQTEQMRRRQEASEAQVQAMMTMAAREDGPEH